MAQQEETLKDQDNLQQEQSKKVEDHDAVEVDKFGDMACLIERYEDENQYHYIAQLLAPQKCDIWIQDNLLFIEGEPVNGHNGFSRSFHLPNDASHNKDDLNIRLEGQTCDIYIKRQNKSSSLQQNEQIDQKPNDNNIQSNNYQLKEQDNTQYDKSRQP